MVSPDLMSHAPAAAVPMGSQPVPVLHSTSKGLFKTTTYFALKMINHALTKD